MRAINYIYLYLCEKLTDMNISLVPMFIILTHTHTSI